MKTNQNLRLFGGKNREYNVVLVLGGRGVVKGAWNKECPKVSPSSVPWTPSPSRGEGNKEEVLNRNTFRAPLRFGFTLIELLVVVLIIGILAAVAVPQYKMAVDKTRLMKLVAMTKNVRMAEEAYYMENNAYTYNWDELDVGYGSGTGAVSIGSVTLRLSSSNLLTAQDDKIPDVVIYHFYTHQTNAQSPSGGGISCYALPINERANKLCQNLTHKKTNDSTGGGYNVYKWE